MRLEAEQKAQQVVKRKKKATRFGWLAGAAIIVLFFVWLAARNNSPKADLASGQERSATAADLKKIAKKPVVTVPATVTEELVIKDLVTGTGPVAQAGDNLTVKYVGVSKLTGQEFDSSWARTPPTFDVAGIGKASVITGWNEGLLGMRVGSRRELIIPPAKGYGDQGSGTKIKPNDTLVFVIDLVKLARPAS